MGNAIGFPLCVGLGMVTGAVVAYVQESCYGRGVLGVEGFKAGCKTVLVIQDLFQGCCVYASMHRCMHAVQASSFKRFRDKVPGVAGSQERLEVPCARRIAEFGS